MNLTDLIEQLDQRYGNPQAKDCALIQEAIKVLKQQAEELNEAGHMIGVLREYISDIEKGLESSIKLNKAQVERQEK